MAFTGTDEADKFTQGLSSANIAVTVSTLGGDDTIILDRDDDLGGDNRVDAGSGNDGVVNHRELGNIIELGTGNDTYVGLGFGSFATEASDQVFGGGGNDKILVQTFHSFYAGGSGNDEFVSVGWQNTFNGGKGRDSISFAARDDDFTQGGTAVTIDLKQGFAQTGAFRQERLISIEDASGSGANDVIRGSGGANILHGLAGDDEIGGGAGNDSLFGDAGGDLLLGGGGADRFIYASLEDAPLQGDFVDEILDFSALENDKIDLSAIDAKAGVNGDQAFQFHAGDRFLGAKGELIFTQGFVAGDVNGDGRADFAIQMDGLTSIGAGDFIL